MDFSKLLESSIAGPLPYRAADNLPFGVSWNKKSGNKNVKGFASWARELPGIGLAASLEIPYANARGAEVNADTARAFGRDLARAILKYLSEK